MLTLGCDRAPQVILDQSTLRYLMYNYWVVMFGLQRRTCRVDVISIASSATSRFSCQSRFCHERYCCLLNLRIECMVLSLCSFILCILEFSWIKITVGEQWWFLWNGKIKIFLLERSESIFSNQRFISREFPSCSKLLRKYVVKQYISSCSGDSIHPCYLAKNRCMQYNNPKI